MERDECLDTLDSKTFRSFHHWELKLVEFFLPLIHQIIVYGGCDYRCEESLRTVILRLHLRLISLFGKSLG